MKDKAAEPMASAMGKSNFLRALAEGADNALMGDPSKCKDKAKVREPAHVFQQVLSAGAYFRSGRAVFRGHAANRICNRAVLQPESVFGLAHIGAL